MNKNKHLNIIDYFLARGKNVFHLEDAIKVFDKTKKEISSHFYKKKKSGDLISIGKGLYYACSPTEKKLRKVSHEYYIDELMKRQNKPYYVGLLSAAVLHGAAHNRPMIFQIMVKAQYFGTLRNDPSISFHKQNNYISSLIERKEFSCGSLAFSSPELTLYDLIKYERYSGTMNNIILVLKEIQDKLHKQSLKKLVSSTAEKSHLQRLGYLLEHIQRNDLANIIYSGIKNLLPKVYLSNLSSSTTTWSPNRWNIVDNFDWKNLDDI